MNELLKVIDKWLQAEKDNVKLWEDISTSRAYHRGCVATLTRIGKMIRKVATQQAVQADAETRCHYCINVKSDLWNFCPECGFQLRTA